MYIYLYKPQEELRACECVYLLSLSSLPLSQRMTQVKQQVILTFHLSFHSFSLPERDLPHLQATKDKTILNLPVSSSIPGEMCEHGQMFELLELMGKRKRCFFQMPGII